MPEEYSFDELPRRIAALKENMRLAVVFGGDKSREGAVLNPTANPRSWKSYEAVAGNIRDALKEAGYRRVDLYPDDLSLFGNLKKHNIDMVWLNSGGVQGYIPTAHTPGMLEMAGIPYVGHNPLNAGILDNKHVFKFLLQNFAIPTAPFVVWSRSPLDESREKDRVDLRRVFGEYPGPFVVKPTSGRASLHVHVADDYEAVWEAVDEVYAATRNHVLIEVFLPGREFCVSVCGPVMHRDGSYTLSRGPSAFSFVERLLEEDERIFTSMDTKAITDRRTRIMGGGADIPVINGLRQAAGHLYSRFSLETLVRIDFRMDTSGNLYVLEANPKPDLKRPDGTVTSLTCCGLASNGMGYIDLIESLIADRIDYLFSHRPETVRHLEKYYA